MLKFILIVILLMLLFRALRKFIFISAHNAFNNAAEDFRKRQEAEDEFYATLGDDGEAP